jgi:hypothetical protein
MKLGKLREEMAPWAGLLVGLAGAGLVHQFGSQGTFNHCAAASPAPNLIAAGIGVAVTILAAMSSWRVVRSSSEGRSRRLVGVISVGTAALFVMAMLLPMIASLVIPPCFG